MTNQSFFICQEKICIRIKFGTASFNLQSLCFNLSINFSVLGVWYDHVIAMETCQGNRAKEKRDRIQQPGEIDAHKSAGKGGNEKKIFDPLTG